MPQRLALALIAAALLLQLTSCHYYIKMTPDIIISDLPFIPPNNINPQK